MEQLKRCPFCGGEAELLSDYNYNADISYWVECTQCYIRTDGYFEENKDKAIKLWNTRCLEPKNTNKFNYPTRQQLESLLGKKVKIKLCNKDNFTGILHKTRYKDNYYLLLDENGIRITDFIFRVSHVYKVEVIDDE